MYPSIKKQCRWCWKQATKRLPGDLQFSGNPLVTAPRKLTDAQLLTRYDVASTTATIYQLTSIKNFRNSWQVLWNFSALVLLQCPNPSPPCAVSSCRLTKFRPSPETSQVPGPTQFKEKPRPWELKASADLWPSGWGGCGDGIHMAMIPVNICIWNQLVLITIIFDQTICKQVSV